MSRIESETDSQLLVQVLNNIDDPCGVLIKEIKTFFLNSIRLKVVQFCPRACNSVADVLAAFGAKLRDEPQALWPGHALDFALVHVASNLAVSFE
jgi:hypothetical protein